MARGNKRNMNMNQAAIRSKAAMAPGGINQATAPNKAAMNTAPKFGPSLMGRGNRAALMQHFGNKEPIAQQPMEPPMQNNQGASNVMPPAQDVETASPDLNAGQTPLAPTSPGAPVENPLQRKQAPALGGTSTFGGLKPQY